MSTNLNATQLKSALIQALVELHGLSDAEAEEIIINWSGAHFHDDSTAPIAWNDVQAIKLYNEIVRTAKKAGLTIPEEASEGYNQHYHTSDYDGGYLAGAGVHDHKNNSNSGFAFAVFHPATSTPQKPWEE